MQADNVFGMTYAEARRMAGESLNKIEMEKSETLKETSKWIPEHERIQDGNYWFQKYVSVILYFWNKTLYILI